MAVSILQNPLNPIELETHINTGEVLSGSYCKAYKIGRLVFVHGQVQPRDTGVNKLLFGIRNVAPVTQTNAPIAQYGKNAQECYVKQQAPNSIYTQVYFNVTESSMLKFNFCFISIV